MRLTYSNALPTLKKRGSRENPYNQISVRDHLVQIGDLLVTSDTPGVAMKSEPVVIASRKIHSPGTLIGQGAGTTGERQGRDSGLAEFAVTVCFRIRVHPRLKLLPDVLVLDPDVALFEWSSLEFVDLNLHATPVKHLRHLTKVLVDSA